MTYSYTELEKPHSGHLQWIIIPNCSYIYTNKQTGLLIVSHNMAYLCVNSWPDRIFFVSSMGYVDT